MKKKNIKQEIRFHKKALKKLYKMKSKKEAKKNRIGFIHYD